MINASKLIVTQHLLDLLDKQVQDHGLVVWYDPERAYEEAFRRLEQRTTDNGQPTTDKRTIRYDGSFLKLRREIDPLLNDLQPPRLVVYVPMDQASTDHALVELEAAGVVMQPGQQPPNRNTRLSLVARNALRPLLGDENGGRGREAGRERASSRWPTSTPGGEGQGDLDRRARPHLRHRQPAGSRPGLPGQRQARRRGREEGGPDRTAGPAASAFDIEFPARPTLAERPGAAGPACPADRSRGRAGRRRAPARWRRSSRHVARRASTCA